MIRNKTKNGENVPQLKTTLKDQGWFNETSNMSVMAHIELLKRCHNPWRPEYMSYLYGHKIAHMDGIQWDIITGGWSHCQQLLTVRYTIPFSPRSQSAVAFSGDHPSLIHKPIQSCRSLVATSVFGVLRFSLQWIASKSQGWIRVRSLLVSRACHSVIIGSKVCIDFHGGSKESAIIIAPRLIVPYLTRLKPAIDG